MRLTILYRGPLSSCNYGCAYCPFAKHQESADELVADRRALEDAIARPTAIDPHSPINLVDHASHGQPFADCLQERACSNAACGCHIGYVHLDRLRLAPLYGDGLLERIPAAWPAP